MIGHALPAPKANPKLDYFPEHGPSLNPIDFLTRKPHWDHQSNWSHIDDIKETCEYNQLFLKHIQACSMSADSVEKSLFTTTMKTLQEIAIRQAQVGPCI